MAETLTRSALDRRAIEQGGNVVLGCPTHGPKVTTAIYQDGDLRLLCSYCGFEAARVKVASDREGEQ